MERHYHRALTRTSRAARAWSRSWCAKLDIMVWSCPIQAASAPSGRVPGRLWRRLISRLSRVNGPVVPCRHCRGCTARWLAVAVEADRVHRGDLIAVWAADELVAGGLQLPTTVTRYTRGHQYGVVGGRESRCEHGFLRCQGYEPDLFRNAR